MGRSKSTETDVNEATVTEAPATEMPDWATRAMADSQMDLYVPPSANQWRRLLTGPELMEWVKSNVDDGGGFDADSVRSLFERAAGSATEEAILSDQETTKGREIPGVILSVHGIRFQLGKYEDGCPYFSIFNAVRTDTNVHEVVSLGGWVVCAQTAQLHYLTTELPEGSPFLVPEGSPGAVERLTFPLFLWVKRRETMRGFHVNTLVHPMLKP